MPKMLKCQNTKTLKYLKIQQNIQNMLYWPKDWAAMVIHTYLLF